MRVAAEVRGPVKEPYLQVHQENSLGMVLRPGSMEIGLRRSVMRRVTFEAGEMGLCTPRSEQWIGSVSISDAALIAACDRARGNVGLRPLWKLIDARLGNVGAGAPIPGNAPAVGIVNYTEWKLSKKDFLPLRPLDILVDKRANELGFRQPTRVGPWESLTASLS
jgi:hypothetical protein